MLRVRSTDLQEGMIVADDIYLSGIDIPLVRRGVSLSQSYIDKVAEHGVPFIHIILPNDYRGKPGETVILHKLKDDLVFEGKVQIEGGISEDIKITAGESVVINGDVSPGCIISSATGGAIIKGAIKGSKDKRCKVEVKQKVSMESSAHAEIKTEGDVIITHDSFDSTITSKGEISAGGRIVGSQLISMARIKVGECGEKAVLIVKPYECRQILQDLLKLDVASENLKIERNRLVNELYLIKKLGKAIEELQEDQRKKMTEAVARLKAIEAELTSLPQKKEDMTKEMEPHLQMKRILINGDIHPNTKIMIDNYTTVITEKSFKLAFYIKDKKVIAFKM